MHNLSAGFDQFHVRRIRMFHFTRWKRPMMAAALPVLALSLALTPQAFAAGKTVTAVMHSDLRVIDPGFTTAYITRDHGYMVYDTVLATDSDFKIQPQMAEWKVSGDKLTYTLTLRDGLKCHDGAPVTAEHCVASVERGGTGSGPPIWTSGENAVKVHGVQWITMAHPQTGVNPPPSADKDFMENPPWALLPVLTANNHLKLEPLTNLDFQTLARMNFLSPP